MLSKRSGDAPGEFEYPLEVEIVDDCSVWIYRVHLGCVMELLSDQYLIDLVHIPLHESKVIMVMDWLSANGTMIDCRH